jgi:YbbR domain-containing protein
LIKLNWGNNWIRVLALLLAVIMWVYVSNEQNPVREKLVNVSLEHNELEQNYILTDGLPESVRLRIQGNQNQLNNLAPGDFKAMVNIPEGKTGEMVLPVQVSAPAGLRIAQVIPEEVSVVVDRVISKQIPVAVSIRGTPERDYTALAPQYHPDVVTVRGPSRLVNEISQATAVVDIQQAVKDVTQNVTVTAGSPDVTLNPATIQVVVPVVSTLISKAVPVLPQVTGTPAEGYAVKESFTEPATVLVYGPPEVVGAITEIKTAPVSIQGAEESLSREVKLAAPQGVTDLQPDRVNIQIEVEEDETPPAPPDEDKDSASN